jgi:hypothetical protein
VGGTEPLADLFAKRAPVGCIVRAASRSPGYDAALWKWIIAAGALGVAACVLKPEATEPALELAHRGGGRRVAHDPFASRRLRRGACDQEARTLDEALAREAARVARDGDLPIENQSDRRRDR